MNALEGKEGNDSYGELHGLRGLEGMLGSPELPASREAEMGKTRNAGNFHKQIKVYSATCFI